jgi:glucose/arabinose dehydrogenase
MFGCFFLCEDKIIMGFRRCNWALIICLALMPNMLKAKDAVFPEYQIEQLAEGLDFPWSLAFLPSGALLVTERTGQLRILDKGKVSVPLNGLPDNLYIKGQGGLLDVILHPDFQSNSAVYLSYVVGTDDQNALQVMRAKLTGEGLIQQQVLFTVTPFKSTPVHFAGRMTFLPDSTLLITTGDGFDFREDAQRPNNLMGKVIRINADGSIPSNNPFFNASEVEPKNYVFSLGHRNAQAILYDPVRKAILSHEHGPDGGDELNVIQAGLNYGWPVITLGNDYMGSKISPFTEYPNMQQPLIDWTPSIAPSGMAVHSGEFFSELNGDLLVSVLKFKQVRWVQMHGMQVLGQTPLFEELDARIRDVRVHADGSIYLLTDSANGGIYRVTPK